MNPISLLNWMLLSTALLGVWWLCYRLALRQERSFAYNRAFLVLGPLLAGVLPLLPIAWPVGWGTGPAALPKMAAVLLPAVSVSAAGTGSAPGLDWAACLQVIYVAGAVLAFAQLAYGLGRLWLTARTLPREQHAGYTLVETHGRLPTSSFGHLVFWDETLPLSAAEARQVLRHELAHVGQGHTYDRLLLELLRAVLWFNPFVHLSGRALALTHEFLADEAALHGHAIPASYTQLLARQVASRLGFSAPLAHSFSHSQTLSRIAMIQKTNPIRRWKQALALPLLGVLFVAVACEKASAPAEPSASAAQLEKAAAAPPPPIYIGKVAIAPPPGTVYTYVEQMPQLPGGGGNKAIVEAIQLHLTYPKVPVATQRTGRVFVSFTVTDKGEVQAIKVVKGLGEPYDQAVITAIQKLPKFEPGKQDGKTVSVSFTVPIQFEPARVSYYGLMDFSGNC